MAGGYSQVVQDLIDEWDGLATARLPWEKHWRDIARYVLPSTDSFDRLLTGNRDMAINSVVSTPVSAEKSAELYDTTSLWAIERLTAGLISLKTPETEQWHDLAGDDLFGNEPTYPEEVALERLRNYMFAVRSNPMSGFWGAHRAAIRSMCAFGDGWMLVEENHGKGPKQPYRYEWRPLPECYPGVSAEGRPNRMFSVVRWSCEQVVRRFGVDKVARTVVDKANDPKNRHDVVRLMHAVRPRDDVDRNNLGTRGSAFASYYCMPDEKHLIGEGGYYEFPFHRYAWSNTGNRPFSEGPVSYAIGEIKSLQEMAKNELISTAAVMRPPIGVHGKNFTRLNWNPGAVNPGLISPDGKQLFAPLSTGARPDFAQAVMEQRRNNVREMTYLNLWQIIIQDKTDTATQALIKAQEKGEMLGPVGISLNEGLAMMVDREVAILGRKRAFERGSPLEMPETMGGRDVNPRFTSPLDRLRRMGEVVGMQRLVEFALLMAGGDPTQAGNILARFDIDEMLDKAREILGAPVTVLRDRDEANAERQQGNQMQQMMGALMALKGGGEAAKAMGEGGAAMAGGAEALNASPAAQKMIANGPGVAQAAQRNPQAFLPA